MAGDPVGGAAGNILACLPPDTGVECFEDLASGGSTRIERIVSRGQVTPDGEWYDQAWREWVMIVAGAATVLYEDGREYQLRRGDYLDIPAHTRHRVTWTDPDSETVWLAVHYDIAMTA